MNKDYRKILHVDMDAFYASVEQRNNPKLQGKPVVVGGSSSRGVVAAASYEAREFGIHSAMSSRRAQQLCPELIFVPHHFESYKTISKEIHDIFRQYTNMIEPLSLDEAFLDVTENKMNIALGQDIAKAIKEEIKDKLNLTASAGVSYNKFLAKIASDMQKPNGLTVIHPKNALKVISKLPIEAFWGVGRATAKKMHALEIHTGNDLQSFDEQLLMKHFGKYGSLLAQFAKGEDPRLVEIHKERKSVGCEKTFGEDIFDIKTILEKIKEMTFELEKRIAKADFDGYTLTLKIKRDDFKQITRSHTTDDKLKEVPDFLPLANQLFTNVDLENHRIRLIGMSVSNPAIAYKEERNNVPWKQLEIPFREW